MSGGHETLGNYDYGTRYKSVLPATATVLVRRILCKDESSLTMVRRYRQKSTCMPQQVHRNNSSMWYGKPNGLPGGVSSMIGLEAAAGCSRTVKSTANSSSEHML